ncbi:hypothetical protein J2Z44_003336 [Clostridium punense]|uniref:DUF4177 domain-containing protein n=1 Tax=Clostridium punense TaxID=1054297 RepID=A0ABS4K6V0_9CLOT|nr:MULTISPECIES: DUF4177 domain-containing protein [Clostridium]EQB87338.1 hypothetical protein M918_09575 [Clostridium sp. BL8]MBP2023499.1 hypothetical protein [Clostridium punense]
MYEYKYVKCDMGGFFTGDNHQEIINEFAKQGWRLVQILPLYYSLEGRGKDFEIIFEREIK